MPIDQIIRAVAINELAVSVQAWCYTCDDCGRRDTFADIPMPEGCSEMDAQRKGWVIRWDSESDGELCRCPPCAKRKRDEIEARLLSSPLTSNHQTPQRE